MEAPQQTTDEMYFTNPAVLDEFKLALKATSSTQQERFARRFCRWLMSSNNLDILLDSVENIMAVGLIKATSSFVRPKPNEIAALYKMIMAANIPERKLYASIVYDLGGGMMCDIFHRWRILARGNNKANRFPYDILPFKTHLYCRDGGVYESVGRDPSIYVIDHDGKLILNPHEIAYNDERLVAWAYSIEPKMLPKYIAMFLNRDHAKGKTMNDALNHAYAENWGIVMAILDNHHFTDGDTNPETWDKIAMCNMNYNCDQPKNIQCLIKLFERGYKPDSDVCGTLLSHGMADGDVHAVCKLMSVANYDTEYAINPSYFAAAIVKRYKNLGDYHMRNRHETEKQIMKHCFSLCARPYEADQDALKIRDTKKTLISAIFERLKGVTPTDDNAIEWLKELLDHTF